MSALQKLMPVLIESGFTVKEAIELLTEFAEESVPGYLECVDENKESMDPECCRRQEI